MSHQTPPACHSSHFHRSKVTKPLQTEAGWGRRVTHGLGLSWPLYSKHFSGPAEWLQKLHTLRNSFHYTIPAVMKFLTPETWEVWRDLQTTTAPQHCKLNTHFPQACRAYSRSTSLPSSLLGFHSLYNGLQVFLSSCSSQHRPMSYTGQCERGLCAICQLWKLSGNTGAWLTWSGNSLESTYIAASGSLWLSQFHWLGHTKLQFTCNFPPQPQQNQKSFWLGQAAG